VLRELLLLSKPAPAVIIPIQNQPAAEDGVAVWRAHAPIRPLQHFLKELVQHPTMVKLDWRNTASKRRLYQGWLRHGMGSESKGHNGEQLAPLSRGSGTDLSITPCGTTTSPQTGKMQAIAPPI